MYIYRWLVLAVAGGSNGYKMWEREERRKDKTIVSLGDG
jgi:hypothetical protein